MVAKICPRGHIYQGARCTQCPPPEKDPASYGRRVRSTVRWHRAKERVLNRDEHRCTYGSYPGDDPRGLPAGGCLARKQLDVHHITALEDDGEPYADVNLRTLCRRHHGVVQANYERRKRSGEDQDAREQEEIVEPE